MLSDLLVQVRLVFTQWPFGSVTKHWRLHTKYSICCCAKVLYRHEWWSYISKNLLDMFVLQTLHCYQFCCACHLLEIEFLTCQNLEWSDDVKKQKYGTKSSSCMLKSTKQKQCDTGSKDTVGGVRTHAIRRWRELESPALDRSATTACHVF
jgi:hypothetical protein